MKTNRKSGIELLRIIAMFVIVLGHFIVHACGFTKATSIKNPLVIAERLLDSLGIFKVNIFILITGFFMIEKRMDFNKVKSKLFPLWRQVWGYSVVIAAIVLVVTKPSVIRVIASLFPILLNRYWFITTYFLLIIMTPLLNRAFDNIDQKTYKKIAIAVVICFSVWPTIIPFIRNVALLWFIALYIVGGYIKKYGINLINNKLRIPIYLLMVGIFFVYSYVVQTYLSNAPVKAYLPYHNSLFSLIASVALFNFFCNLNIKEGIGSTINWISKSVIVVYIITENILLRKLIYTKIFNVEANIDNGWITIGIVVFWALVLFSSCLIIDFIRRLIVQLFLKIKG